MPKQTWKTLAPQLRLVWQLSLPAILTQITTIAMQYIDSAMVGALGADASAAIGLVASSTWLFGGVTTAVSAGFSVQVAHRIGAGEDTEARTVVRHGLAAALTLAALLALLGLGICRQLPYWLGGGAEICADASAYFLTYSLMLPFSQLNSLTAGFLQCAGDMVTPSVLNAVMCGLDVVCNALLIPHFGVLGAGMGTALACALVPVLLLAGFKGPVYRLLKVEPNEASIYTTMFCGVAACLHQGKTLSNGAMEDLQRAMTLEEWRAYYSRFEGHDRYLYALPNGMNLTQFTAGEAFSIYLEALARYPDIVIKDRLDGMNLLWDVTQPDESYNTDYSDHAFIESDIGLLVPGAEEGEAYRNPALIARAYRWAASFTFPGEALTGQLHNMLLWRSGAWLILLCVLVLYWLRRHLASLWLCAAPLLGNLLAMVLVLYHQSFRYVYFVQPLTLCLLLLTVLFDARRRRAAAQA